MKWFSNIIFSALLLLMVSPLMAQRAATIYALNPSVVGNQYSVEIWAQRTNVSGTLFVGTSNFIFDVDQTGGFDFVTAPTLSLVNSKYTGDALVDDYGPMTVQWSTVASIKKINVTVNYVGNVGLGGSLITTAPNGEMICKVSVTIANAAKTASLTWDQVNSAIASSNSQVVTNTFSGSDNSVLPVELTSFNAIAKGRNVELAWQTATEVNNSGFEIQRKQEGSGWAKVAFVEGNGNSATEHAYSYKDVTNGADAYSYRLKQIDRDGKFTYSSQVEVTTALTSADYNLSANYPNPFNPSTKFSFAVKNSEQVSVKIFNTLGQEVTTLFNGVADADKLYEMNFNASGLASGTYFYMLRTSDRYEIKKMLLMK